MIEVHVQIAGRLLQGAGIIAVHTAYVVDIGTKDQALLPALPIFRLEPDVGPGGLRAVHSPAFPGKQAVFSMDAVKAAEGNIALFQFPISGHGFQLRGTARGFHGIRERTAVPEKLGVVVFGVPDGQVRKELGGFAHRAGVHNGQRDRAVDVPLAGNGNPLIGQLAQRDAGKSLQEHGRGPAVHACTGTVFFMDRLPDGQLHGCAPLCNFCAGIQAEHFS